MVLYKKRNDNYVKPRYLLVYTKTYTQVRYYNKY